jgi:dipeptidyl aminopeptidase/acylaminoacyl peptidase
MVLEIHGGPMSQYGYTFFHEFHVLAAQGYVVVFTNPRGSSGRGLKFMNSIERRWGTVDYDDLMTVTDTMVAQPYIDRRRLGVAGGSYGGFMTTWITAHTNRFKAGVTMRQAGNLLQFFGASDFGYLEPQTYKKWPWDDPLLYLRRSPNFYAKNIHAPLLIIHSENDLRCPIAQSEELFATLKVLGRTTEFVRFEGESHGLTRGGRPQNRLEHLNRTTGWFRRYL